MKYMTMVFAFLISSLVFGQRTESTIAKSYNTYRAEQPVEFAYLRTDKKVYFSGESLGFCLTILDLYFKPSQISKIAYVELIHEDDSHRKRYAFKVTNGMSKGSIDIPLDVPTGNYQLVAYTHFMNNFQLERALHRRLIYIQNSSEPVGAVAKSFEVPGSYSEKPLVDDNGFSININETSTKVLFEINSPQRINKEYFIVSEGFRGIQFVARTKLNKKKTNLAISKDQFSGGFQKIILLDDKLKVLAVKAFYLNDSFNTGIECKVSSNLVSFTSPENMISRVELTSEVLHQDSIDLFRRIYQLYYNVPSNQEIEELTLEELTSDSTLAKFSIHISKYWTDILSNQIAELKHRPENNLHLRGQVEGDLTKLKGAILGLHLFDSNLDFLEDLDETGKVDLEVFWPIETDRFYCSITSSRNKDVSGSFNIVFDNGPDITYGANRKYYPQNLTDPLLKNRIELSYILSTFSPVIKKNKFFWQDYVTDRVVKVDDYRNLSSFEELVREAVIDLSVVKEEGKKSLNIYNAYGGGFRKPQLVILNNHILNGSTSLFELPIEKIKTLRMIYSKELLDEFGEIFIGGVVIVEADDDVKIEKDQLETKTGFLTGFYDQSNPNKVSNSFSWSKLLQLHADDQINISIDDNKESGSYQLNVETLTKDGIYRISQDRVIYD